MNETIRPPPALASNVPWPTSDDRVRVPDTSMLPGSNPAPPPVVTLLNDAAQRAAAGGDALACRHGPASRNKGRVGGGRAHDGARQSSGLHRRCCRAGRRHRPITR